MTAPTILIEVNADVWEQTASDLRRARHRIEDVQAVLAVLDPRPVRHDDAWKALHELIRHVVRVSDLLHEAADRAAVGVLTLDGWEDES